MSHGLPPRLAIRTTSASGAPVAARIVRTIVSSPTTELASAPPPPGTKPTRPSLSIHSPSSAQPKR
jgi:hypothetical protein